MLSDKNFLLDGVVPLPVTVINYTQVKCSYNAAIDLAEKYRKHLTEKAADFAKSLVHKKRAQILNVLFIVVQVDRCPFPESATCFKLPL